MRILNWVCCSVMITLAMGCASVTSEQQQFEQERDQQQWELANKLELLWQRAEEIPQLQQGAPLTSSNPLGQQAIRQQNQANLMLVNQRLAQLDQALWQRKQMPGLGDRVIIELQTGEDQADRPYVADDALLYRGEQISWPLQMLGGESILLKLTWSEHGTLFVDDQPITNLSPATASAPMTTSVLYYGDKVQPQSELDLTLILRVK